MKRQSVNVATTATEPQKVTMMTVNIKIEQPDIILVESLEHKQCAALIMNVRILFSILIL